MRNGLFGIGWFATLLLVVLVAVDVKYNHAAACQGFGSLLASLVPHQSVTVGKP
jgi:hypothetical protein